MYYNIISYKTLKQANAWSIQSFLPNEKLETNSKYRLVELSQTVSERKESISPNVFEATINYVGLENIEANTGRLINFEPKGTNEIKSSCKRFYKGDILYGRLRPTLNKVWLNSTIESGVCSTEIIVLTPKPDIVDPIYLAELLRTTPINNRIINLTKGAALPRINVAELLSLEIPVPDLSIQTELGITITQKRKELEYHLKKAKSIPTDIDSMITLAYSI